MEKYDLIILGSGAAAFGAAIKAVDMGAKVAMIEKGTLEGKKGNSKLKNCLCPQAEDPILRI